MCDAALTRCVCTFPLAGKWAVTKVNGSKYELAYTKATARLMKYFRGGNDNGTSMEVTTPTLARLRLEKDEESTEKDYAFSYWLPEEYQVCILGGWGRMSRSKSVQVPPHSSMVAVNERGREYRRAAAFPITPTVARG